MRGAVRGRCLLHHSALAPTSRPSSAPSRAPGPARPQSPTSPHTARGIAALRPTRHVRCGAGRERIPPGIGFRYMPALNRSTPSDATAAPPADPAGMPASGGGIETPLKGPAILDMSEVRAAAEDSPAALAQHLGGLLARGANYRVVSDGLAQRSGLPLSTIAATLAFTLDDGAAAAARIPAAGALQHLLIDLIPAVEASEAEVTALTVPLFVSCLTGPRARLAAKLATTAALTPDAADAAQPGTSARLAEYLRDLCSNNQWAPAANLALHFRGPLLSPEGPAMDAMFGAALAGRDETAVELAGAIGGPAPAALVRQCVSCGRLRAAVDATKRFGLEEEFPTIENDYKESVVTAMMERGQWGLAASWAGKHGNAALREAVVRGMMAGGEVAMAAEYRLAFELEDVVPQVDEESVAREEAERAERFLKLDLDASAIVLVDSDAAAATAAAALGVGSSREPLGIDAEWRPSELLPDGESLPGGTKMAPELKDGAPTSPRARPAALLQIASTTACVLIDLLALPDAPEARRLVATVLADPNRIKIGFDLTGDLKAIRKALAPAVGEAGTNFAAMLDLKGAWAACSDEVAAKVATASVAAGAPVPARRQRRLMGLSGLCEAALGRPLDKACQVSDWERRPLTQRQVRYAATDAWVLPVLYARMVGAMGGAGAGAVPEDLRAHVFSTDSSGARKRSKR